MASHQEVLSAALGRAREARSALSQATEPLRSEPDPRTPAAFREALARTIGALYAIELGGTEEGLEALSRALDGLSELRSRLDEAPAAHAHLDEPLISRLASDLTLPRDELERALAAPDLSVRVGPTSEHNFYTGFSGNIAEGGVFVVTYDLLPLGQTLRVAIRLPDHPPIVTRAQVAWIREANPLSGAEPGMGLELLELEADSRTAIERFMAHREPLFHEM